MAGKLPGGTRPPRKIALVSLSLLTLLLLAANLSFFSSTSVRQQLSAWFQHQVRSYSRLSTGNSNSTGLQPTLAVVPTDSDTASDSVEEGIPSESVAEPIGREVIEEERLLSDPRRAPVSEPEEEEPPQGSLIIPALDLNLPVGLVPVVDGHWDISELGEGIGWMETTGTRPGDDLAMVIIGHVTMPPPGGPGPFLYLSHLKTGDEIRYQDGDIQYIFTVENRTGVKPDDVGAIYQEDGKRIILVTCIGWNPVSREYENRLLVEAVLVGTERLPRMLE